jgi:holo-[acyl-carrier protein] synthase
LENFHLPPGGILLGLGTDLIEVERIARAIERQGDRFIQRIFTEEERAYCFGRPHPHPHLAARFAAKEAVSKCFTTGIGAALGWKSVSIYHGERQEPLVRLDEKGQALLQRLGATRVLVTLSHTQSCALAVAALVRSA